MLTEDNRSALPELMKFTEALTLLKISRSKADRLIRSRDSDFPRPFKIGNERFFRASDLRSWIELKANASKWLAECRRRVDAGSGDDFDAPTNAVVDDWTVEDDAFF